MTPDLDVHLLAPGDVDTLRDALHLFGRAFDDEETYGARQPDDAWLGGLLARDTFVALVARRGEAVVGALAGYVLPKFEQARSEFYLYDLAVDEAHRRQGVATALMEALRGLAAERGWWVIFVQADLEDDAAIALYSRLGRREDVLHFDIAPARA